MPLGGAEAHGIHEYSLSVTPQPRLWNGADSQPNLQIQTKPEVMLPEGPTRRSTDAALTLLAETKKSIEGTVLGMPHFTAMMTTQARSARPRDEPIVSSLTTRKPLLFFDTRLPKP